jgi:predicted CoA-binding protein
MDHDLKQIANILKSSKTIAVVGLSPKPDRASNAVARYLIKEGYDIIPVNPGYEEILGKTCYPSLKDIPGPVHIVDIFRRPEDVPPVVRGAVEIKARAVWMQQGIRHEEAAAEARAQGLEVVEDWCIKRAHQACGKQNLL